jgi:hypothetical protein
LVHPPELSAVLDGGPRERGRGVSTILGLELPGGRWQNVEPPRRLLEREAALLAMSAHEV